MEDVEFERLVDSGLLADVERIVVEAHAAAFKQAGRKWTPSDAYRWLRYEDPKPVTRLRDGVRRLRRRGANFSAGAVDKACARARKQGYLN